VPGPPHPQSNYRVLFFQVGQADFDEEGREAGFLREDDAAFGEKCPNHLLIAKPLRSRSKEVEERKKKAPTGIKRKDDRMKVGQENFGYLPKLATLIAVITGCDLDEPVVFKGEVANESSRTEIVFPFFYCHQFLGKHKPARLLTWKEHMGSEVSPDPQLLPDVHVDGISAFSEHVKLPVPGGDDIRAASEIGGRSNRNTKKQDNEKDGADVHHFIHWLLPSYLLI
jgi:hypothetical protein